MTPNPTEPAPAPTPSAPTLVIASRRRRFPVGLAAGAAALAAGAAALATWERGYRPADLWAPKVASLATVAVDEGGLTMFVTETGTLESADNATEKCKVESLLGMVGGTTAGGAAGRTGGQGSQGGQGGQGGAQGGTQGGGQGSGGQQAQQPTTTKKSSTSRSKAKTSSKASTATGGTSSASSTVTGSSGVAAAAAAAATSSGSRTGTSTTGGTSTGSTSTSSTATTTTTVTRPTIRSFSMQVAAHQPLRGTTKNASGGTQQKAAQKKSGGGGGGGGGGRGGMGGQEEKPGSTRIISILPEGTRVKAGEVVCELDSSTFRDEIQSQAIKVAQAQAYRDQARAMVKVNEISLEEYRDGIYPQDVQLIRQYVIACRTDQDRARKNLEWSREALAKGLRATTQTAADVQALERADIALREALGMEERLERYTRNRLLKNLQAKFEASRADMLAQEGAFKIESDRLRRLELMVQRCTMKATRDGLVVYAQSSSPWGRQQGAEIQEGVTVRDGQAIFNLPNPQHMRVKARVNESKIKYVHPGQRAEIIIDAFPDRPLQGTVAEVTAIPAPTNGPFSDTKVYFANVDIDAGGFDDLRPGLSAQVSLLIDTLDRVTRVPVGAVRWSGDSAFAAVSSGGASWRWAPVKLGRSDSNFVQVLSGLSPGDRVIRDPTALPAPVPARDESTAVARAGQ